MNTIKLKIITFILFLLFVSFEAFSCTIFYFVKDGKMYFCNNEDWSNPNTEIRFNPAKNGKYAWVYLGFSNNWAQGGVNEKGLCWDWVAGFKNTRWRPHRSKKNFRGNLSEEMIKNCATVEEAITFLKQYNEQSFSYARIMLADKKGNSAIIGWKRGKLFIERNKGPLHAFGYKGRVVKSCFTSVKGSKVDIPFLAQTLNNAHQEGRYPTQYSNIISITEGKIYLYQSQQYDKYIEIDYIKKLKGDYSKFKISDLFNPYTKNKYITLNRSK